MKGLLFSYMIVIGTSRGVDKQEHSVNLMQIGSNIQTQIISEIESPTTGEIDLEGDMLVESRPNDSEKSMIDQ